MSMAAPVAFAIGGCLECLTLWKPDKQMVGGIA